MNTEELLQIVENETILDQEMIKAAFEFWLNDHEQIRSPFPSYIHNELKQSAIKRAIEWAKRIPKEKEKELGDEINAERFEELMFEEGMKLVKTEDEVLTIKYPFMPRIGDPIEMKKGQELVDACIITDREVAKNGDMSYIKIKYKSPNSDKIETTSFELPE
jgi:hypothetical protein